MRHGENLLRYTIRFREKIRRENKPGEKGSLEDSGGNRHDMIKLMYTANAAGYGEQIKWLDC